MGKNVKKEAQKAFRKLGPMFYVEALRELESLKLYDINKIGHVCIRYAKKCGFNLTASNSYCQAMVRWLESCGLVEKLNGFYVPTKDWQEKVQKRFPTDNVEELLKTTTTITTTEAIETPAESSEEDKKKPVTYRDYYQIITENIGDEFVTLDKIRSLVKDTYKGITGEEPDFAFIYAREGFIKKSLVESIKDDDGTLKFLRVSDWMDRLNSNKRILSVIIEKKEKAEVAEKQEELPMPKPKKFERPFINIWLNQDDTGSLVNFDISKDVLFREPGRTLVRVQLVDPNLDLLMTLRDVVVVKHYLTTVRELFKRRREFHVMEIRAIDSICQQQL